MNKQLITGLCAGVLLACAAGAIALRETGPKEATISSISPITAGMEQQYAEVVGVSQRIDPEAPEFADVVTARAIKTAGRDEEVCEMVTVTHQAPAKDERQVAGTAAGAVIGGVLGNQVGGGNGKKAATVAGAVVGGIIGKTVQAKRQSQKSYETSERQCWLERGADRITGFDVTYRHQGVTKNVQMEFDPGPQLPVVKGQLITGADEIKHWRQYAAPAEFAVVYALHGQEGEVIMSTEPKVGDLLLTEEGRVVTDPAEFAEIEARQHQVVGYRVVYRLGNDVGEVRLAEKPTQPTLLIDNGQVIMADSSGH